MKNYVEGELLSSKNFAELEDDLTSLGYEIEGTRFRKYGQVESIVNELAPLVASRGVDVSTNLFLEEYNNDGIITGKYSNGKISRFHT
ncbi:MAG: hypothetical protein ACOYVD_14370 [Bacillota bacterium]